MCMNVQLCTFTQQVPCVLFLKYVCGFLYIHNLSNAVPCILPNLNFLSDKWMNKFLYVCGILCHLLSSITHILFLCCNLINCSTDQDVILNSETCVLAQCFSSSLLRWSFLVCDVTTQIAYCSASWASVHIYMFCFISHMFSNMQRQRLYKNLFMNMSSVFCIFNLSLQCENLKSQN